MATPIGNLGDLSTRACDILRSVSLIAAEDTRVSGPLLRQIGARADLIAVHAHNERSRIDQIIALLRTGTSCALISDAGTPAISDPGARLVAGVQAAGLRVIPVPGPSAVTALLSVAGLDADRFGTAAGRFLFEGFLPARSGQRRQRLTDLVPLEATLVLLESPHRIAACLADLAAVFGADRWLVIGRELTKRFEQIAAMPLGEAGAWVAADGHHERGEFVLAIAPAPRRTSDHPDNAPTAASLTQASPLSVTTSAGALMQVLLAELPPARAAKIARRLTGASQDDFYAIASALKR